MTDTKAPAAGAGTVAIGSLQVRRLGFGAMQITGPGIWGEPADRDECKRVLRRAVELGVDFIDTADSYGPYVSEELIREALHPYGDVVIGTKGGLLRTGPGGWVPCGQPAYLRQEVEMSLRRLGLDTIDLYQLHRIDPAVPVEDSLGELVAMQGEGKIRHIGLSEVNLDEIKAARAVAEIVSVQNLYNLTDRRSEAVLDHCAEEGIAFIPWFPIATGALARPGGVLDKLTHEFDATPAQLALAWLLRRSPAMLPIPGTKSVTHLEENVAAATLTLTDAQYEALTNAA
ncbi:aldo/keto reductase [Actinophytocola sp.]|uniref:aldo/keto reductase n=1 Tax=Actinophytocola sp. TaxID=1872138 RepID=UPI002D7EE35D|nr:aldo/keto reductase [Actinophytocola sp.]HET9140207.1 aldo/keto reductase [Actinophytocola sp.]